MFVAKFDSVSTKGTSDRCLKTKKLQCVFVNLCNLCDAAIVSVAGMHRINCAVIDSANVRVCAEPELAYITKDDSRGAASNPQYCIPSQKNFEVEVGPKGVDPLNQTLDPSLGTFSAFPSELNL